MSWFCLGALSVGELNSPRVAPLELRSPSDSLKMLQAKVREYMENGARLGWLIDPQNKVVEIYRPNQDVEIIQSPKTLSGEDVLPGFTLDLSEIIWFYIGSFQAELGKYFGATAMTKIQVHRFCLVPCCCACTMHNSLSWSTPTCFAEVGASNSQLKSGTVLFVFRVSRFIRRRL